MQKKLSCILKLLILFIPDDTELTSLFIQIQDIIRNRLCPLYITHIQFHMFISFVQFQCVHFVLAYYILFCFVVLLVLNVCFLKRDGKEADLDVEELGEIVGEEIIIRITV